MNYFWLDASALAKRYVPEIGSPLMNHLFASVPPTSLACLLEGIGEVISILVRARNRGGLSATRFRQTMSRFSLEVIRDNDFEKLSADPIQVTTSWQWIEKHSLNSTDSIILQCVLDKASELRADGHNLILVSADARLIRAANAESVVTFNPETDDQTLLDSLF
jgi:uncharacterized protein